MNKLILILTVLMFWASPVIAQQAAGSKAAETTEPGVPFEGIMHLGYRGITNTGNTMAGEYEYLESGPIGSLDMEWDPLPHRFVLESTFLNARDYFGELDYAYKDIVVVSGYVRELYHNLNHFHFGIDDPATPSPSFDDSHPNELYGIDNKFSRVFLRLKTPDFPFHVYAEARTIDREGSIQQRYLRELSGGLALVSKARAIDWKTEEFRVGANSHLGPIEVDFSHTEKKFEAIMDKTLSDTYNAGLATEFVVPHNIVPDLESSWNTLKVHTTYSGKVVLAGTYSSGDKKNRDSATSETFSNTAGDLTFMPITSTLFALKYRHYEHDLTSPATANNITAAGATPVAVRDSISSSRDVVTGSLRYRATDRLTVRGEYSSDTTDRTRGPFATPPVANQAYWLVPESTTKSTAKLGVAYRIMKKMTFRADYSAVSVDNPAYATDPDKSAASRASLTWMPLTWFNMLLSYGMVNETRDQLGAPLGGGRREAEYDQALASMTLLVGKRSSLTASFSHYQNKVDQTVTVDDGTGLYKLDGGVPYDDIANVGTLSATVAPLDGVNIVVSGSKCYSRGNFRLAGANTAGIAELSDLKVIDSVYTGGIELQHSRNLGSELRYQYRKYDDQIDNSQDGRVKMVLGTMSLKW